MAESDEQLMERVQQGDASRLEQLMLRYERPLFTLGWRLLRDRSAAEDAFQETFLKVWRNRATYRKGATFRPWLYRICLNHCRDELRRLARRPETELSDDYALADPGAGPEEQAISLAQAQSIGIAIAGLPDKQRDVFELVHYQGLPYAEVSEALEIPVGTVKSRMFHALRQLSTQLNTLG